MGPDPTRAYFWPAVNKRLTLFWLGYFLTQPDEIFLDPKGKTREKFGIFRGNFPNPNPNHRWLTRATKNWPDPTQVKNFDPYPSLLESWPKFYQWWDKNGVAMDERSKAPFCESNCAFNPPVMTAIFQPHIA